MHPGYLFRHGNLKVVEAKKAMVECEIAQNQVIDTTHDQLTSGNDAQKNGFGCRAQSNDFLQCMVPGIRSNGRMDPLTTLAIFHMVIHLKRGIQK